MSVTFLTVDNKNRRRRLTCSWATCDASRRAATAPLRNRLYAIVLFWPSGDDTTRKKLLQMRMLTLATAIDICRSAEATTRQLKAMTSPEEVQALRQQSQAPRPSRSSSRHRRPKSRGRCAGNRPPSADRRGTERRCKYCDRTHTPSKNACPAFG